jgi:hypothetical protein
MLRQSRVRHSGCPGLSLKSLCPALGQMCNVPAIDPKADQENRVDGKAHCPYLDKYWLVDLVLKLVCRALDMPSAHRVVERYLLGSLPI